MPCDELSLDLISQPTISLRDISWPISYSSNLDLEADNRIKSHRSLFKVSFYSHTYSIQGVQFTVRDYSRMKKTWKGNGFPQVSIFTTSPRKSSAPPELPFCIVGIQSRCAA